MIETTFHLLCVTRSFFFISSRMQGGANVSLSGCVHTSSCMLHCFSPSRYFPVLFFSLLFVIFCLSLSHHLCSLPHLLCLSVVSSPACAPLQPRSPEVISSLSCSRSHGDHFTSDVIICQLPVLCFSEVANYLKAKLNLAPVP